jgi:DNA sulfur modification protein DndD
MMLRSLMLENFRQFYGVQTITFASGDDRNVTVVYGANGAGKTALLNAFTWCLYKQTTEGFERPTELVNHRAWAEANDGDSVTCRVVVEFEHESQVYTTERVTVDRKAAEGRHERIRDADVSLEFIDEGGKHHSARENPDGSLNQILPERLHRFFFFDGERIENLVKPAAYAEIEDAIKTVLGLEVVERSVKHLAEARRILEDDLSEVGSDEDRRLTEEVNKTRTELDELKESRKTTTLNRTAREDDLDRVNTRLSGLEEAHELQQKREELESSLTENEQRIHETRETLGRSINERGYFAFVGDLAQRTTEKFESRRQKGEIPSDIKLQFVVDLLERGKCICGTALHEGDEPYVEVETWKAKAGRSDVEAAWTRLPAQAAWFTNSRDELFTNLHQSSRDLANYRETSRRLNEKLSEISESLSQVDSDEIRDLEGRRDDLKRQIEEDTRRLGAIDRDIEHAERLIREKEAGLEEARAQDKQAELAKQRVRVAREAREVFEEILTLRTEEVRTQLDERLKQLYADISFKAYVPELRSNFQLDLTYGTAGPEILVAKSTGENQILSLAFVGALAERARERSLEAKKSGGDAMLSFQGGIYPIVMDSPFGSLDESYQKQIARAIPALAPQVVIFVSKSQGLSAVRDELAPRVGKEYVNTYYTPKAGSSEPIELHGEDHPYICEADGDYEWAVLEVV